MSGDDSRSGRRPAPAPPMSAAVRAAVRAHSAPVRPLRSPEYRAGTVLALGIAVAAVFLGFTGLRSDAAALGSIIVWVPALLRVAAGAWLLILVARDASPSEGATSRIRMAALLAVPLLLAGSAEALARAGGGGGGFGPLPCYAKVLVLAIPATVLGGWLLARAYPLHPVFAAAAGCVGAAMFAEAALHLTCPSTSPPHTLLVHGGAVATLAVAGAVVGAAAGGVRRQTRDPGAL